MRGGRHPREMLLGLVFSALCHPFDPRMSTIHGFAHLVHEDGRCLRKEKVSINFGPLFLFATDGWLIFSDAALFAGESLVPSNAIFSAAWYLHDSSRSGLMNFYRLEDIENKNCLLSLLRLQCWRL